MTRILIHYCFGTIWADTKYYCYYFAVQSGQNWNEGDDFRNLMLQFVIRPLDFHDVFKITKY